MQEQNALEALRRPAGREYLAICLSLESVHFEMFRDRRPEFVCTRFFGLRERIVDIDTG